MIPTSSPVPGITLHTGYRDRDAMIVEDYRNGVPASTIYTRYHVGWRRVKKLVEQAGVPWRTRPDTYGAERPAWLPTVEWIMMVERILIGWATSLQKRAYTLAEEFGITTVLETSDIITLTGDMGTGKSGSQRRLRARRAHRLLRLWDAEQRSAA